MTYQGFIDGIQAGQPFEAKDATEAIARMDRHYDGMDCGAGNHLTQHGETITVEVAA